MAQHTARCTVYVCLLFYFLSCDARTCTRGRKTNAKHAACTAPAPFEKLKHWAILLPEGIACRDMSIDATQTTEKYVRFDFTLLDGPDVENGRPNLLYVAIDRIAGSGNNQFEPPNWENASTAATTGTSKPLQIGGGCEVEHRWRSTHFSIHRGTSQPRGAMCSSRSLPTQLF